MENELMIYTTIYVFASLPCAWGIIILIKKPGKWAKIGVKFFILSFLLLTILLIIKMIYIIS